MSFIFQSAPENYDLRTRLVTGFRVLWLASRYQNEMRPGDLVYFWLAGDRAYRGLYGWGVITGGAPVLVGGKYRIEVEYRCNFLDHEPPMHISSDRIKADSVLRDHQIVRMPIGTNFTLTGEEDAALRRIIGEELGSAWVPRASDLIVDGGSEGHGPGDRPPVGLGGDE